jgi:hypothetical protein
MGSFVKKLHGRLGCFDCHYAVTAKVGKEPCCSYFGKLRIGDKGNCLTRIRKGQRRDKIRS